MILFLLVAFAVLMTPRSGRGASLPCDRPASLTGRPGDIARGQAIVADRRRGLCLLCHSGPFAEPRTQGDLAPDLAGAGKRWTEGQLRQRLVDPRCFAPETIMPAYGRTTDLVRVATVFAGNPILTADEIEDVVAFLVTLRQ
ncbi:sulfur oxidation c-type cytochrome SoxX [Telmatospirillum sp.]|uniref:sulfur oxidation c-type cytochrome SoxX n=1 Tax=Telmatospirillum sp. TaxID=2079197 RepID=UPI002847D0E1|nr:sulfur oxidation c-type cytochrome SoxX [Telmatospirillum sp.]MDR3435520.1 sulfur oxidation c-type cytochrome SoxX [Telmatospirillum sp.]